LFQLQKQLVIFQSVYSHVILFKRCQLIKTQETQFKYCRKFISGKKISLSPVVEDYLAELSRKNISQQKELPSKINNSTNKETNHAIQISDEEIKKQLVSI
jgi:hypothetical protein